MEKIDKFELMLMDSPINILGLPDGVVEQIVELMAKCYTTRNDEVVKMGEDEIERLESQKTKAFDESEYDEVSELNSMIRILTHLLTKLKEVKK